MWTISFQVSKSLAADICTFHCTLSKGIVDKQIACFAGNFVENFMIFGEMKDESEQENFQRWLKFNCS